MGVIRQELVLCGSDAAGAEGVGDAECQTGERHYVRHKPVVNLKPPVFYFGS